MHGQESGVGGRPAAVPATRADLPIPRTMSLAVDRVTELSPSLREIGLAGEDLLGFKFLPGQDLMLRLPLGHDEVVSRRYTIRRADPALGRAELNVVMHGDGPAARWAGAVSPGDRLAEVVGPRGKITLDSSAGWHLFLGDETYIPGTLALLEALPGGAAARAFLEIPSAADQQPVPAADAIRVEWLVRGDRPPGEPGLLLEALRGWQQPEGLGHVYIAAEVRVALALRDELVGRGLAREQISAKGYWDRRRANASRGEPDEPA
ncbi:MAG TPA: siderophore-interacting protein [Candidatus Dormibacteraeota bacterium]